MHNLAFIPARGGSKRLPRKNIATFMGKPMIAWTIEAAQHSNLFERVIVSTEDSEIAEIAKKYGAEIASRDTALASDKATVVDVCLDFLNKEQEAGKNYDVLCCLYATAPLRTADDIKATMGLLEPGTHDFVISATHYDLPPQQALKKTGTHEAKVMWPDLNKMREDELGELVVDNGSTYAVSVPAFIKQKSFYGPNLRVHMMPRSRSHDINEPIDLEIMKFFAEKEMT